MNGYSRILPSSRLIGVEGELGKLNVHYTFHRSTLMAPSVTRSVEGSGVSIRESRLDANQKTSEILDVSQLQVILLSTETVQSNIIDIFDVLLQNSA